MSVKKIRIFTEGQYRYMISYTYSRKDGMFICYVGENIAYVYYYKKNYRCLIGPNKHIKLFDYSKMIFNK